MESIPRIGLILISTSEAEIRGLIGRRLKISVIGLMF